MPPSPLMTASLTLATASSAGAQYQKGKGGPSRAGTACTIGASERTGIARDQRRVALAADR
eukprot:3475491-Alexandrium_andersonii.AAC.1